MAPSQVRLRLKVSNLYRWKFIPCGLERPKEESGFSLVPSKVGRVVATIDTVKDKALSRLTKLFLKNISNHSTSAYRELCEGVDKTFKAVPLTLTLVDTLNSIVSV